MSDRSENAAVMTGALALLGFLVSLSLSGFKFKVEGRECNYLTLRELCLIFMHCIETGECPDCSTS